MVRNTGTPAKKNVNGRRPRNVGAIVESIVGCKWSIHVLAEIRRGVNRPGALAKSAAGLTTKVLNERLTKMVRFGILQRIAHPEVPPRVEYHFTPFGERFLRVLDAVKELEQDVISRRVPTDEAD